MAKQFAGSAKFQIPGGQATPAPPVGTSLGKYGINLGQFVQQFNERTKEAGGMMIPVVVTVYNDRSFDFITKSPPAAVLLKKAANIAKGSAVPNKDKVGTVTRAQMEEIAKTQNDRPQRQRRRSCRAHGRRHGAEHGVGSERLISEKLSAVGAASGVKL